MLTPIRRRAEAWAPSGALTRHGGTRSGAQVSAGDEVWARDKILTGDGVSAWDEAWRPGLGLGRGQATRSRLGTRPGNQVSAADDEVSDWDEVSVLTRVSGRGGVDTVRMASRIGIRGGTRQGNTICWERGLN